MSIPPELPEYRVHSQPSRVEHTRHIVEIVALIAAALWAFYVFVYQERLKPAAELPDVEVTRSLSHEPLRGNKELVTITITIKNIGRVDVAPAAVVANAAGLTYTAQNGSGAPEINNGILFIVNRGRTIGVRQPVFSYALLYSPFGKGRMLVLRPGEEYSIPSSFVITRGVYDTVIMNYGYCIERADNTVVTMYRPKLGRHGFYNLPDLLAQTKVHPGLICNNSRFAGGEFAI